MEGRGNHGRRLDGAIGIPGVLSTKIGEEKSDGVEGHTPLNIFFVKQ